MSKMNRRRVSADSWKIARQVWATEAGAIRRLAKLIDQSAFERCLEVLANCRGKILTAGVGTSAAAARKIAHSLCCVARPALFLSPGDGVHGGLGAVTGDDVVIAISKGGNTREVVNLLKTIKAKRAFLIGVTEKEDSALGQSSDLWLRITVEREPDPFNMLATASTMAVVAVFDAVCIALMIRTRYTREQFALIHPAGAVGDRLTAKARHVPKPTARS
jgi:D-arabinose 5-phosphate isomerase GutQ